MLALKKERKKLVKNEDKMDDLEDMTKSINSK